MPETPEQKWNRVQKKLQNSILKCYPNLNRRGCPGAEALLELAKRAASFSKLEGDPEWEHTTHCSPCYKEFLEVRDRLRVVESKKAGKKNSST